jgi:hypothetical protein
LARTFKVAVHARIQIERGDAQISRSCQPMPERRLDHGERLRRLLRIEVVALGLVGEIETWADDADAAYRPCLDQALGLERVERLIDGEVRAYRRV